MWQWTRRAVGTQLRRGFVLILHAFTQRRCGKALPSWVCSSPDEQ